MKLPALILALLVFTLSATHAAEINKTLFGGAAIKGYDAVAYFHEGKPQKGQKAVAYEWKGAIWLFASESNKAAFVASPDAFAPQYGGFCAWAVSQGSKADIDPNAWRIVDGKLYLNYSPAIQSKWEKDIPGLIKQGDANWPKLKDR